MKSIGDCPLCLAKEVELCDSHIFSAGIYRGMKKRTEANAAAAGANADPISITAEHVLQSSKQLKRPLLCSACEQLLSARGERWVLSNALRGDGTFPIRSMLLSREPDIADRSTQLKLYSSNHHAIDIDATTHFALGTIWRMSVVSKRGPEGNVHLGTKYEEEVRRYLLGELPFPANAALSVSLRFGPLEDAAYTPYTAKRDLVHIHRFAIPGLVFTLIVGKDMPNAFRTGCFTTFRAHFISATPKIDDTILQDFVRLVERVPEEKRHLKPMVQSSSRY